MNKKIERNCRKVFGLIVLLIFMIVYYIPRNVSAANEHINDIVYRATVAEEAPVKQPEVPTKTKYVKASRLNVRKSPNGEISHVVNRNDALEVIEHHDNGWTSISKDGNVYYVKTEYVADAQIEPKPEQPKPKMVLWKPNVKLTYYHARGLDAHDNKLDPNFTVASNVLPQYTKLYIEGIGYRTVMDTGSNVLNDGRVDICCPTYNNADCLKYASRMPQCANVWIVTE